MNDMRIGRRQLLLGAAGATIGGAALIHGTSLAGAATGTGSGSNALVYVSGNGDDGNNGLTAETALRSLQAAYAALPSGGGTITAAPGRYDVGAGLVLNRTKPVWIMGTVKPRRYVASNSRFTDSPYPAGPAAVIFTSNHAASLVTTGQPAGQVNGYGFRFTNLVFEFSDPLTKCGIDANSVNMGEVDECLFWADIISGPAAVDAVAVKVYTDNIHGDDGSWWRIHDNVVGELSLCIMGNDTGTRFNSNQHVIRDNICLGRHHQLTTTRPAIRVVGGNRCVVRDNNIEAYHVGIQFQGCWMCVEDSDGGEVVDVFVDLLGSNGCRISPIGISTPTTVLPTALLVRGDINTYGNFIVAASVYSGSQTRTYDTTGMALVKPDNVVMTSRGTAGLTGASKRKRPRPRPRPHPRPRKRTHRQRRI